MEECMGGVGKCIGVVGKGEGSCGKRCVVVVHLFVDKT